MSQAQPPDPRLADLPSTPSIVASSVVRLDLTCTLQLIANGATVKEAAARMGVTYCGVKNFLANTVYPELRVKTLYHAIAEAMRRKLIQ